MLALIFFGIFINKKIYPHITIKSIWYFIAVSCILLGVGYIIIRRYTDFIGEFSGRTPYAVELGALRLVNLLLPTPNNIKCI